MLKVAGRNFQQGHTESAILSCRQVLELDPTHLGALELIAKCLWVKQDFVALEQTTRCLIALNPYEPGYFGLRGMALRALGRYSEAAQSLRRDPESVSQLADLEALQTSLVRDLEVLNPKFAARLAKDPAQTLEHFGISIGRASELKLKSPAKSKSVKKLTLSC